MGVNTWRLTDAVTTALSDIQAMCDSIASNNLHPKMIELKKAIQSLDFDNPQYQDRPILLAKEFVPETRSSSKIMRHTVQDHLQHLSTQLQNFGTTTCRKFLDGVEQYNTSKLEPHMEAAFRLENVLSNAESGTVPESLITYFEAARAAEYLPSETSEENIRTEYTSFCSAVKELYDGELESHPHMAGMFEKLERTIYNRIISASRPSTHTDVTDLLLSVLSRSHCESIYESMGSVIKNVVDDRNIDFKNIQEEMFVSYNGPQPYAEGIEDLLEDALNMCWPGKPWHIYRETKRRDLLKFFNVSLVVDRKKREANQNSRLAHRRVRSKSV